MEIPIKKQYKFLTTRNLVATGFLVASIVFYVLGLIYPLMSTKYQVWGIQLKHQEVTLFDSVRMFWDSCEYLVASIILVFTFILPILKYIELALRLGTGRQFLKLQSVDKWNMIDVFLVAMLLLNFKMNSRFIVMRLELGTNFIALAVLTRLATILLVEGFGKKKAASSATSRCA
ncbi:MAG: paraquat-inducible protein A [Bacteroidales bacterium]|nr:paraquat-inducible protein A [Bacteroidales bacterium]